MATKQPPVRTGLRRIFSLEIRKRTVRDIEKGRCSVSQAASDLQVSSTSIYKWLNKHSLYLKQNKRLIVEDKSEVYRSQELEKKVKELEAMLGRKQMEIELLNKMIELAEEEYKVDIKRTQKKRP